MKATEIKPNVAYGVLSPHTYKSKNKRDPQTAQRGDLFKGTLHDTRKYRYSKNSYDNKYPFPDHAPIVSPDSKETWGLLFVTDNGQCIVVRPVDVVGIWDVLETRWVAQENEHKRQQEQQELADRLRHEQIEIENKRIESVKSLIISQVQKLHPNAQLSFSVDTYAGPKPVGKVSLTLNDFNCIVERLFELIEIGETV